MCSITYQSNVYILSYRNIKNRNKFKDAKSEIQKKNKIDCIKVKGVELSKKECELKSMFL